MLASLWEYRDLRKDSLREVIIVASSVKILFQSSKLQGYGHNHKHTEKHTGSTLFHKQKIQERGAFCFDPPSVFSQEWIPLQKVIKMPA